ncbi:MAG: hypothetical protein II790_08185, partial [Schwartzia sp.]|nr:hypothetical protein [Schwartzia sp. (in: firmicutes)]
MKMKKISKMKNNCTSMWNRGHFDRKAQAALALAVSLWIAGGGVVVAGQITTVETDYTGELNGNHSGDNWGDRTGDPNDNEVTVNAAVKVTGDVRGGYYFNKDGKVTNNIVTINGTVTKAVYGGESGRGYDVMGNQVTVTGTVGENVYGGRVRGGDGTATGNTVTVNGGTINMNVYGGYSFRGDAEKNTVTIEGGEVEHVYGGNSTGGDVLENEVYIQGGTVKHNVYGGFANENEKKAEANEVTISGGEVSGHVYGGHSDSGQATNNKVTISGGVVRGQVYGGETFGSMENATGNEVTINSGTVLLDVYGGDAQFGGAAHNHVIIKGKVSGRVYGGRSSNPSDGGWNKVEILGGTVDSDVYGDFKNSCNNTVVLHDATVGGSVCGDAEFLDDTGNTLILSGSSTVNDSVNNFETIEFDGEKFSWDTTKTVLTANQFSNPDCTLDVTALVNKTGTGTMTLLSSGRENDFETLKLAYNTATQATPVTLDSSKTSQVVKAGTTKTSEDKGITIAYNENEHTVSLDAANNYKNVNYTIANNVNKITLGTITWSKDGTARELPAGNYTFNDSATIDTSSFEFNTPSYIGAGDSMTLISNATGLTAGDSIAHSQSYTNYDNCIKLNATLTGSITRTADTLGYTAIGTTLDSVDLANWNGTTTAVPAGWTSNLGENSIKAAGFTAPTIDAGTSKEIITTNTANFFSDDKITGAMKYGQSVSTDNDKGVWFTGFESKGVKASDDGKKLIYARSNFNVRNIILGEMTWGTPREATASYDFANVETINAGNLEFTNPDAVTGSGTLLTGAANLATGASIAHTQNFTKEVNGATLYATLSGNVTRETAGQIGYTATGTTLDSISLTGWNGTEGSIPTGWTSALGNSSITAVSVDGSSVAPGNEQNILTSGTENFFNDNQITDALKYKEYGSSSDTCKGVTLTYSESKGVKASTDGKNLVYARSKFDISKTAFGEMTWGVSRDESSEGYNYSSAAIDASGLKFTNWNPEDGVADSSTILLLANDTLSDFTAIDKSYSYSVVPNSGVTVDSVVSGKISKSENNIVYTVKENKATKLNFDKVNWLNTSALIDHATTLSNVTFSGADVDTTNIKFTNLQTAASDDKMILVSSFGSTIGTVTGTEFSVGKGKGKGNAYLEGNDLKYVVTQGVAFNSTGDNNAIDAAGDPVSGEVTSDVIGGVAQNDGIAKENKMEVQAGSNVTGNVTAATSQHGSSLDNEAKITDASVSGNVTGAMTENGTAADNKATVENTTVNVDVIGAKTVSGLATGNIANVTGGKVEGNVIGAQSTSGTVSTGNKANVSGAEIGGNVCGGISKDGESNANKTELSNGAKVSGNVYGGMSEEKTATANSVTIKNATVDGDVYGAKSKEVSRNNEVKFNGGKVKNLIGGGCETAVGNTVTVENGTVEESVYGGKADVDAQNNCVILSGGKVTDTVYGGWSASINGKTQGNSVLLYGTADVSSANIAGGNLEATRNTLTIGLSTGNINTSWTGGEQGVKNISNFENITFAVVPWSESKAALTITDGTASDLSMSKIDAKKVHFTDVDALKKDDAMTLLDQSKAANKATSIEEKSEFTAGTTIKGKGSLSLDDNNNVRFTVNEMGVSEQSHNTVMSEEVALEALGAGD